MTIDIELPRTPSELEREWFADLPEEADVRGVVPLLGLAKKLEMEYRSHRPWTQGIPL